MICSDKKLIIDAKYDGIEIYKLLSRDFILAGKS